MEEQLNSTEEQCNKQSVNGRNIKPVTENELLDKWYSKIKDSTSKSDIQLEFETDVKYMIDSRLELLTLFDDYDR